MQPLLLNLQLFVCPWDVTLRLHSDDDEDDDKGTQVDPFVVSGEGPTGNGVEGQINSYSNSPPQISLKHTRERPRKLVGELFSTLTGSEGTTYHHQSSSNLTSTKQILLFILSIYLAINGDFGGVDDVLRTGTLQGFLQHFQGRRLMVVKKEDVEEGRNGP